MATTTKATSTLSLSDCWKNCPGCFKEGRKVETPGNDAWPYRLVCDDCNLAATITIHFRQQNLREVPTWRAR